MKKGIYCSFLNQGNIRVENAHILARWARENKYNTHIGYDFRHTFPADKPIINNRNKIVLDFLKKKEYEYLFMCDDSIIPPLDVLDLSLFDLDVVTPLMFAYRQNALVPLVLKKREGHDDYEIMNVNGDEGLVEVDSVGTGCILIHRRVLEHPKMRFPFKNVWNEDGERIMGQDLNFARRAKECGFKLWVHLSFICGHWEAVDLKEMYQALLQRDIKAGALDTRMEFKHIKGGAPPKRYKFMKSRLDKDVK